MARRFIACSKLTSIPFSLGRPKTDEELIDLFRQDLAASQDSGNYQHELYEEQGIEQLRDFLARWPGASPAQVLHTKSRSRFRSGETTVAGRIDRIDRRPDGTRRHRRLQDRQSARSGRRRREPAALALCHRRAREVGIRSRRAESFTTWKKMFPSSRAHRVSTCGRRASAWKRRPQGIAAGNFDAKPGIHCNFCAYRSLCPEKEKRIPRLRRGM